MSMMRPLVILAVVIAGLGFAPWSGAQATASSPSTLHLKIWPLSPSHAPAPRALVLEPFATQLGLGPNAGDPEVNALKAAGFQVDQLYDTQVTIGVMARLSSYNVVYMHTHSGVNPGGEGVLATGELATGSTDADPSIAPLLNDGSVVKVHVSTESGQSTTAYYALTSSFIRNHLAGSFPSSAILFLNGCSLLKAPLFWQALQAQGAGVMVSWDNESTSQDNYLSGAAFFNEMSQHQTVAGAITALLAAGYGKSRANGQAATIGYLGSGTITLQQAASAPSVPATPAATATSPPVATPVPTSTPLPTATPRPVPGPVLTVSLKRKVAPGHQQTIIARSGPGATIHFTVVFPTGDRRSAVKPVDASYEARFAFTQNSNRIAYQHVFATVIVTARKEGRVTTVTKRYRIDWSPIDVAVVPRTQVAGRRVVMWVHSRPGTPISLTLRFPSGQVVHFRGVTGKRGWANFSYQVRAGMKSGHNHTVVVEVVARESGKTYQTTSLFQIK